MEKEIFEEPEELEEEEPEESRGSEDNPGNEGEVLARLETLQKAVTELQEKESVESVLENEAFRELVRDANAATLESLIEKTPGLDDGVREALRLTLDQMRHESASGDDDEPEPELSGGSRCLELRQRIQTLGEEMEALRGERTAFTEEGVNKRAEDRKVISLLEAERAKAVEELNEILSAVSDAEPEAEAEEEDDRWSR